jgi:transposase
MSVTTLPDLNLLPAEALKALVLAQHEQLLWRESEIEHLKLLIAKLQRMQFGRKSEKLARQIEQLELRLEDLQAKPAESAEQLESQSAVAASSLLISTPAKPARRRLPEHLPRQTQRHEPRRNRLARIAAVGCASWAKMFPRCWSTCPRASSWFAMCGPS